MPSLSGRALFGIAGLTLAGGLSLYFLRSDANPPAIPRLADHGSLAPEVSALVREVTDQLAQDRGDGARWGRLGMVYEANGVVGAAREAYIAATVVRPSDAKWWYRLAVVEARMGRPEDAVRDVRRAIEAAPGYAPAHWRLGLWLLDANDTEGAERAFKQASALDPADPAGAVGLGRTYLQRNDNLRAVAVLERTLAKSPGDRYAMQLLGTAYRRLGRVDEAAFALAVGVGGEPTWADPWTDEMTAFRRGFAVRLKDATQYFLAGQTKQAIPLLEALQREKPEDLALLSHLGEVYVAALRPEDGIPTLERVVAREPDRFGAYVSLASGYLQQNDLIRAREAIDRAIAINPSLGRAYETKGLILWRAGDDRAAREMLQQAVLHDPRAVRAMVWQGMVEMNLARPGDALVSFTRATRLDPTRVDAWVGVGNAAMMLGQFDRAAAAVERAAQLNPDAPDVKQAVDRLRSIQR